MGEIARKLYEFMDLACFEIFGKPTEATLAAMKNLAQAGVSLKIAPQYNGGYIRLKHKA